MERLTAHFGLDEFLKGIPDGRTLPPAVRGNLQRLAERLELLRIHWANRAITVTLHGGWRPPDINAAAGGAVLSRHLTGEAADIKVQGVKPSIVVAVALDTGLFGGIGVYPTWTHLDIRPRPPHSPVIWRV